MSLPLLYEASVPVLRRLLGRLDVILERGERHAAGLGQPEAALLEARLAPDMYPLARQAVIAANFVPRAVAPLAGVEVVEFAADETSFAGLRRHAARQAAWLDGLAPALFEAAGDRLCRSRAGLAEVVLLRAAQRPLPPWHGLRNPARRGRAAGQGGLRRVPPVSGRSPLIRSASRPARSGLLPAGCRLSAAPCRPLDACWLRPASGWLHACGAAPPPHRAGRPAAFSQRNAVRAPAPA